MPAGWRRTTRQAALQPACHATLVQSDCDVLRHAWKWRTRGDTRLHKPGPRLVVGTRRALRRRGEGRCVAVIGTRIPPARETQRHRPSFRTSRPSRAYGWTLLTGWSGSGIWEGVTTEECRRRACTDGGAGSRARRSAPRSAARREGARGRRAVVFINGDTRRHVTERRPVIVTRRRRRQRRREQRERARSTRAGSQCDLCGSESTDRRLTGKSMSATLASGDQGASRRMRAGESAAAAGTAATCGDHGRPLWRQRTT